MHSSSAIRFFILGAPKCGTTSLAHWLDEHTNVFMSPVKEPHFYSTDLANATIASRSQYESLFDEVGPEHRAIGEASTWYLASEEAVPNILRDYPDALFIVMTRDPIEMARSLHHHNLRVLHEDEPDFAKAWGLQEIRRAGEHLPPDCVEPMFVQYGQACLLGRHMERLLSLVERDRVLHVPLEGLKDDPGHQYRRVLEFLGCEDDGRTVFSVANQARGTRSRLLQKLLRAGAKLRLTLGIKKGFGLARLNEREKKKSEIETQTLEMLSVYFADDQRLLRELSFQLADWDGTP